MLVVVAGLGDSHFVRAQEYDTAAEIRWLRVGSLHNWFANVGSEVEYGRRGRACCQNTDQNDGLSYPAEFQFQNHIASRALWIGTTEYDDPVSGKHYAHKVVAAGPRFAALRTEFMPVEFKVIGRDNSPIVVVDDLTATDNALLDVLDDTDPGLAADRLLINKIHTSIGVTVTRKIMAFSQQNHDNYFIYDYVFENTGIIDLQGTKIEKTLTDVVFFFEYRYAFANEAYRNGWLINGNASWGRNTVNHVVGKDPAAPGFEFRAHYAWYGPHSAAPSLDQDWGAPNYTTGHIMAAPHYAGIATLHADKSAQDKTDDRSQPFTTGFIGSDVTAQSATAVTQYDAATMTARYGFMTAGHPPRTHAEEIGDTPADTWGTDAGGYSQGQGFGRYTLAPGASIHIVMAEAVAGLSRRKNMEVVRNWFGNTNLILPDGTPATDRHQYKKAWVQTGIDSLRQTFLRAIGNYQSNYNIPQPPPPPKQFSVTSGGDRIILSWTKEAESFPNFDGYRVFRAIDRPDTLYEEIFSCKRSNVVNSFSDTSPLRGRNYYYYVQSKDDGSTNDVSPGVPLVSSKFYTMTNQPAFLRRPSSAADTTLTTRKERLGAIRVVPNPYHISARKLQFGNEAPDRIAFFGLPPECTIKIYTERGDLIETIEHTDGTGDQLWDSLTSSRQVVVSGLYIAYFEVTKDFYDQETNELLFRKGDHTIRKFIIIR
jgi:hypothetical protein